MMMWKGKYSKNTFVSFTSEARRVFERMSEREPGFELTFMMTPNSEIYEMRPTVLGSKAS
jgi:hypothetical protein